MSSDEPPSKRSKGSIVEFEYTGQNNIQHSCWTNVRFHSSVTNVNDYTFNGCDMKEVVLNKGLQKIGEEDLDAVIY